MPEAPTSKLLRTTTVQAFARTVADADSARRTRIGARQGSPRDSIAEEVEVTFDLPEVGDVVGAHYRLVRLLGEGMFGKVYVAQRLDVPEHQVAMKILPRSLYAGRNVERELVMLATVGHPNVVQLKDHGTTPDYVWLTMPVYQGQTLAERLQERGPLSPRQAYDIFVPVARGLEALHVAGLRHQDVKPENIFLAIFGGRVHPVLLDLGVAAEKDAIFVAGTALYGAPEQVSALSGLPVGMPLSEKMDTYGLAATLLMALVGPQQFPGEKAQNRAELAECQEVRTSEPISPAALAEVTGEPRARLAICFRSWLAFSPEERPTMKEMAEQLEVLLEHEAEDERREAARVERQQQSLLYLKIAITLMLVIGVAGGVLAYNQRATLAMARDLERAKDHSEKSFSELGTCNAAHAADTQALADCRAHATKARDEYKQQLDEVVRSGSSTQAEHAREAQRAFARAKACDEAALQQRRACEEDQNNLAAQAFKDKSALAAARDEALETVKAEKATIQAREAERDQCRAEKLACGEERDALKAAAASRPLGAPRVVGPMGTVAPAPGTGVPLTPPAATDTPAPRTPPPAPTGAPPAAKDL